jgi:hypothetical protein
MSPGLNERTGEFRHDWRSLAIRRGGAPVTCRRKPDAEPTLPSAIVESAPRLPRGCKVANIADLRARL